MAESWNLETARSASLVSVDIYKRKMKPYQKRLCQHSVLLS